MGYYHLVGQEIDLGRGKGGGTLQERQSMGLVGQPRPSCPSFASINITNDLFGAVQGGNQRPDRYLTFTDAEEDPNETVSRWRYDDPFTVFLVLNSLAGLEEMRMLRTHEILGW
jgi:hypothetical protein